MSNQQANPVANMVTPTTKILAMGHLTSKATDLPAFLQVLTGEVPATLNLYLEGKIEQMWAKPDKTGVVFLLNLTEAAEAHALLEVLPLGVAGMMTFDLVPLGPLTPLGLLLNSPVAA